MSWIRSMKTRYHGLQPLEKMILATTPLTHLHETLAIVAEKVGRLRASESFPRSQLRDLVSEILAKENTSLPAFLDGNDEHDKPIKLPPRHFRNTSSEDRAHLLALLPLFGDDPLTLWLQLEELWDYALAPDPSQS